MSSPDSAGREGALRGSVESIVDDDRQNTRKKWHDERVMGRTSASDALVGTSCPDPLPESPGEDIFPRSLLSSTAQLPISRGNQNLLVQGGCRT